MNRRIVGCWCVLICLFFISVIEDSKGFSQETKMLKPFHIKASLQCIDCHNENPAIKAAPGIVCLDCHGGGDRKKIIEMTARMEDNPHEDHEGGLDCTECHYEHQPSKDHCVSCHSFGFKTP